MILAFFDLKGPDISSYCAQIARSFEMPMARAAFRQTIRGGRFTAVFQQNFDQQRLRYKRKRSLEPACHRCAVLRPSLLCWSPCPVLYFTPNMDRRNVARSS
jgi:hypothetical protein